MKQLEAGELFPNSHLNPIAIAMEQIKGRNDADLALLEEKKKPKTRIQPLKSQRREVGFDAGDQTKNNTSHFMFTFPFKIPFMPSSSVVISVVNHIFIVYFCDTNLSWCDWYKQRGYYYCCNFSGDNKGIIMSLSGKNKWCSPPLTRTINLYKAMNLC